MAIRAAHSAVPRSPASELEILLVSEFGGTAASPTKPWSTRLCNPTPCSPFRTRSYGDLDVQGVTFEGDTLFGNKSQEQPIAVDISSSSERILVFAGTPFDFWLSPGGPHAMSHSVFDIESFNVQFLEDRPELSHVRKVRPL